MRTVLMIAYFFPPLGGVGTQRAVKFARYLPEFGWRPVILSVQGSPYPFFDPELMAEVPAGLPVYRACTVEPEHLHNLLRRCLPRNKSAGPAATSDKLGSGKSPASLAARLERWLFVPDGRVGWLPFAITLGKRVVHTERPSVIFSTSAPYTAHLIASRLAESRRLPWLMDLRDPWVDNHFHTPPTQWHRSLIQSLETRCVRRADRVICVTPLMSEEMRHRYPDQPMGKFLTVTNGFDAVDFEPDLAPGSEYFLIRHMGSLYAGRSAVPFLRGLVLALEQMPSLGEYLKVEFVGSIDQRNQQDLNAFITAHNLEPLVSSHPFVTHHQAVRLMQQSQVQLLILGEGVDVDRIYPAKLFEYVGARRPILAVVPPGVTETLVKDLKAGIVADPDDAQSVADAVLEFYARFQQGQLRDWAPQGIAAYERRHLTQQLASILDALAAERDT